MLYSTATLITLGRDMPGVQTKLPDKRKTTGNSVVGIIRSPSCGRVTFPLLLSVFFFGPSHSGTDIIVTRDPDLQRGGE